MENYISIYTHKNTHTQCTKYCCIIESQFMYNNCKTIYTVIFKCKHFINLNICLKVKPCRQF